MTDPHDLPPDDGAEADALAAEYVLGVLALEERLVAQARIRTDADFASRVVDWETRFDGLNDAFASVPAPDLLPQIEARIFGRPQPKKRGWWGFIAGAGVAAALGLAIVVGMPPSGKGGPELTAALAADAQELAFAASYSDGALTLQRISGPTAQTGRDYELWLIVGDAPPRSLGVITDAKFIRQLPDLAPGVVLAVSLEPTGGSATGAPTGPVLVTGVVSTT